MGVYVIALEPNEEFLNNITKQKSLVKKIAGNQIYLDHPPHITVYIMFNKNMGKIKEIVENISNNTNRLFLEIKELNFFKDDKKTNANTIFYDFTEEKELKNFQEKIVFSLSHLDEAKEKYNFIGEYWHPHITVTSIEKEKFENVFKILKENELTGKFSIGKVVIYSYIHPNPPIEIESFELKNV